MIHVLAIIAAKPGQRDAVLAHFRANMPAVHAEQGCVQYEPVIDATGAGSMQAPLGPDAFCVIERWDTMEALAAHAASPHMKEYGQKTRDLLASRTIHILSPAG